MSPSELHHEWAEALDRLDSDNALIDEVLRFGGPVPDLWEPSATLGPIPADLLSRAHEVQRRQRATMSDLALAMEQNIKAREAGRRAPVAATRVTPVYVDTRA